MLEPENTTFTDTIIAHIENKDNPRQVVSIRYVRTRNAFVTSGIEEHFGMKEILIPAHLIVINFELIGAIVSATLETISKACEKETSFSYPNDFQVMERRYRLVDTGEYVELSTEEGFSG
jgi:hypothetical protein